MYLAGMDIGTTGCKVTVYTEEGRHCLTEYREYDANARPNEMNAETILSSVGQAIAAASAVYEIGALGVTSFGETFVLLDEADRILYPSLLYSDPRGSEELSLFDEEETSAITGTKPAFLYGLPKLAWIKRNKPEIFRQVKRVLFMQDFIIYMLTGNAQIDYTVAARSMAFSIAEKRFSQILLGHAGIDASLFSKPVPPGTVAGRSSRFGLKNAFIVNGCHDQIASLLGAGITKPGGAADGIGTVECITPLFQGIPQARAFYADSYAAIPFPTDGLYATYAYNFSGGASLKWYRNQFLSCSYAEADAAVRPDVPTGLLFLPYLAGAATPYMDEKATGAVIGLTCNTDRATLYQAVMEGTGYEMMVNLERLKKYGINVSALRATGGGAKSKKWLQMKANMLNLPITTLCADEVGAAGTVMLTGQAIGVYRDLEEAKDVLVREKEVFLPSPSAAAQYREQFLRYGKIYDAIKTI